MNTTTRKLGLGLAAVLLFAIGCQPEPNKNNRRFGRNAYGTSNQQPKLSSTQATAVVGQSDQLMTTNASLLAAPALNSNPQWALGNVSAQNGVRLWAEAYVIGGGGTGSLDGSRSRIHLEVADTRVGQPDGAGGTLQPFVLHIGYDWQGFEGAEGGISDGNVALRFDQSGYGSLLITGTANGQNLVGQVSFVNTFTNGEMVTLGNFTVPICSFFVCQ